MLRFRKSKSALVVMLWGIVSLAGCSPLKDDSLINVQFDESVQGLQRGDQVYFLGVPIGEVKAPFVLNGRVVVPVSLRDRTVFGSNTRVYFFVAPESKQPGRQSLIAVINPLTTVSGRPRFRGFASRMSLDIEMGVERAEAWWKNLGVGH